MSDLGVPCSPPSPPPPLGSPPLPRPVLFIVVFIPRGVNGRQLSLPPVCLFARHVRADEGKNPIPWEAAAHSSGGGAPIAIPLRPLLLPSSPCGENGRQTPARSFCFASAIAELLRSVCGVPADPLRRLVLRLLPRFSYRSWIDHRHCSQ